MKTKDLIICALFAALTAVFSYIFIPLPFTPVPMNLALLPIFVAGALLGPKNGVIAALVYVLLGAVGLPVFNGSTGGLSILAGPTGGFIVGYISCAYLSGKFNNPAGSVAGLLSCYLLGTFWFSFVTGSTPAAAIAMCVAPFILGDCLKIIAASALVRRLKGKF